MDGWSSPELFGCLQKTHNNICVASSIVFLSWSSCDPAFHQLLVTVKQLLHQLSNLFKQVNCRPRRNSKRNITLWPKGVEKRIFYTMKVHFEFRDNSEWEFRVKQVKVEYCWWSWTWWSRGWNTRTPPAVYAAATGGRHPDGRRRSAAACEKERETDSCPVVSLSLHTSLQKNVYTTCSFPAEWEDLDHRAAATAQLCGEGGMRGGCINRIGLLVIKQEENRGGLSHPKDSFWLRVRQVSGKQAILPRIPTQIS